MCVLLERGKPMTGTRLSEIAQAQVYVTKGGEICFRCKSVAKPGRLWVAGASLDIERGYRGGLFCLTDWLPYNDHPHNRKVIEMDQNELNKLGVPNVKSYADVADDKKPWDLTQSQVVNLEIIILKMDDIVTAKGPAYLTEAIIRGEKKMLLIGGVALMSQLKKVQSQLPLLMTIVKEKTYYEFK